MRARKKPRTRIITQNDFVFVMDFLSIVIPCDRAQRDHATEAALVLHDDVPPFARRGIDHSALMVRGAEVEAIHAIAGEFPVHEVPRVRHDERGIHVPCRAGKVVILTYVDTVRVLELLRWESSV